MGDFASDFQEAFGALYVWDNMEKRGFPITDDVMILDIDELSWEQKQIIASGNELEISELAKKEGQELGSFIMMGATVFVKLVHAIYENETDEKKKEISNLIRTTMRSIVENWGDDAD